MVEVPIQIAIITVTFNDSANLKLTLDSVRKYKKHYHRYFVIDGNSTDGTKEIITQNSDIIDSAISEKDSGIYDAMNKAIRFDLPDSTYLLWLNAGDLLTDWEGIEIAEITNYNCAFFAVETVLEKNNKKQIVAPKILAPYNEKNFFPKTMFMHQGFLVRVSTFRRYMYETKIGLQAENLLMSTCIMREPCFWSNSVIAVYDLNGVSSKDFSRVLQSYLAVARKLEFNQPKLLFFQWQFLLKTGIKILIPFEVFNFIRKIKAKI
ncbi:glycosyltransferase [Dyadobacter sp. CY261]|uniref:glycosyltransferase n=1 Tax=Dyadobacter sp. CY261 TaxID=2907203 RepID=UPI001F303900|nr:glycosyltransferase [Dyadobacter sp. CY261]MCF0075131.1 glycosyltransferase [Dyadobacter sp. CY261]